MLYKNRIATLGVTSYSTQALKVKDALNEVLETIHLFVAIGLALKELLEILHRI